MLTVTDKAKEELQRILEMRNLDPGKVLRLAIPPAWTGDGDFGIVVDNEYDGDATVLHGDLMVLFLDAEVTDRLSKAILDFKNSPGGPRFTLDVF